MVRPEDVVVDFLSVLDPGRGHEVHLVIAERWAYLRLPAELPLAGRLAQLASLLLTSSEGSKAFSPDVAADAITLETGDVAATVWTTRLPIPASGAAVGGWTSQCWSERP